MLLTRLWHFWVCDVLGISVIISYCTAIHGCEADELSIRSMASLLIQICAKRNFSWFLQRTSLCEALPATLYRLPWLSELWEQSHDDQFKDGHDKVLVDVLIRKQI